MSCRRETSTTTASAPALQRLSLERALQLRNRHLDNKAMSIRRDAHLLGQILISVFLMMFVGGSLMLLLNYAVLPTTQPYSCRVVAVPNKTRATIQYAYGRCTGFMGLDIPDGMKPVVVNSTLPCVGAADRLGGGCYGHVTLFATEALAEQKLQADNATFAWVAFWIYTGFGLFTLVSAALFGIQHVVQLWCRVWRKRGRTDVIEELLRLQDMEEEAQDDGVGYDRA